MTKKIFKKYVWLALFCAISSTRFAPAFAHGDEKGSERGDLDHDTPKALMNQVGITQKIDNAVPLDARFKDENGKSVRLGQYLGKKPVILNMISYTCTQVCTAEAEVLQNTLKDLPFRVGKEFDLLTVSIDERDTEAMAQSHKKESIRNYGHKESSSGWNFLTGDKKAIKSLAESVGFRYVFDPVSKEYLHPDGLIVLTPDGHVSRYFYRLEYPARDVKFGLIEASQDKIGTPLDKFAISCFHYNPTTGKYDVAITAILRLAGVATVLGMMLGVWLMLRAEKKRNLGGLKSQGV